MPQILVKNQKGKKALFYQVGNLLASIDHRHWLFTIYIHEKTVWFMVWAIGKQIPYCDIPFGTGVYHLHKSFPFTESLELVSKMRFDEMEHEFPFGNFGLPFKKSRFPQKFSISISISILFARKNLNIIYIQTYI